MRKRKERIASSRIVFGEGHSAEVRRATDAANAVARHPEGDASATTRDREKRSKLKQIVLPAAAAALAGGAVVRARRRA
jgi:hypothetical protein